MMALAAAQAELGQYEEAMKIAKEAEGLANPNSNNKVKIGKMLEQFQAKQPYREPKHQRSID